MQTGEISNLILLLSACGVTTIAPGERFQSGNMSVSAESLTDEETKNVQEAVEKIGGKYIICTVVTFYNIWLMLCINGLFVKIALF